MSDEQDPVIAAQEALHEGDPQQAFQILRSQLRYPRPGEDEATFCQNFELFAQIAQALGDDDLEAQLRACVRAPQDAEVLYELGYELIEQDLCLIAAHVLSRANRCLPENRPIVTELVHALETMGRNHDACAILLQSPKLIEQEFLCRYLLAFNHLMCADIESARALLPTLLDASGEDEAFMASRISSMLQRVDAMDDYSSFDDQDLRGWHYAQHSAIITHISPHGFEEGMRGRYALFQESYDFIHEGLLRLRAILEVWGRTPERIFVLPERGAQILAHAAAPYFNAELEAWPEHGSNKPGLIIAHDLNTLETPVLQSIYAHREDQILFTHAACWTEVPPFSGDITTFLYQVNTPPWSPQMRWNPDKEEVEYSEPDERDAAEIAAEILETEVSDEALDDLTDLIRYARALSQIQNEAKPAAFQNTGNRQRFWECSPVKSNRF